MKIYEERLDGGGKVLVMGRQGRALAGGKS
jgi:hypothetical protein